MRFHSSPHAGDFSSAFCLFNNLPALCVWFHEYPLGAPVRLFCKTSEHAKLKKRVGEKEPSSLLPLAGAYSFTPISTRTTLSSEAAFR